MSEVVAGGLPPTYDEGTEYGPDDVSLVTATDEVWARAVVVTSLRGKVDEVYTAMDAARDRARWLLRHGTSALDVVRHLDGVFGPRVVSFAVVGLLEDMNKQGDDGKALEPVASGAGDMSGMIAKD